MRPYANASQVVQLDQRCRCERQARNRLGRRSCEHERDGVPVAAAARAARQQREESERKHSSRNCGLELRHVHEGSTEPPPGVAWRRHLDDSWTREEREL